jgi:hypothetical protein
VSIVVILIAVALKRQIRADVSVAVVIARLSLAGMLLLWNMIVDTDSNRKRLPDPKKCRTRYLGPSLPFSDCLVENLNGCEYGVRFGFGVICRHPDRRSFEKTDPLELLQ